MMGEQLGPNQCSALSGFAYLTPAPRTVVGHHRSDEINKCLLVEAVVLEKLDTSRSSIVLTLIYESSRVGRNGVVNKHINVVFGSQQGADIAIEREVWTVAKFDRFYNVWLCLVDELAYLITNCLLPLRKGVYIFIDTGIVGHCGISSLNEVFSNFILNPPVVRR
jgi:hypothetical protein